MRRLINIKPHKGAAVVLGALPLAVAVLAYTKAASDRQAVNAADKLLPTIDRMAESFGRIAFYPDALTGKVLVLADTVASLQRLGIGIGVATAIALVLGLALGVLPLARATLAPLIATIAVIPPIAILPILFIIFGLGETSKIVLIAIGIAPLMVRDLAAHVAALPNEQILKAQTLGASTWQLTLRVALPQALPRLIDSLRLSIGPAWVFLISAEAIASDVGLGYRIFLVRRYLSMDIILPYVVWIALLALLMDIVLRAISREVFPWYHRRSA
ncbi:ABC transporter permease [Asticcacaulis excentricus]|uniref:Binding-protein-dependent transport systems inner membrane component n=1 Tax=Asticcacaulis excentricus (strain ATCC 15261 / DSM 4724 / KCTC 12464 / NCIMB 9791 / VKM B-1370 / CB 48) TaxID=573065 RepID=E8RVD0_ASTEC|nr:ABC transporter permease subunit [Asticcacaulis excentricus]ADU15271.1 binding-protein-dependent transport systems inner membrane component [Asticcacaulis excentricus CB 48]